ncbi:hypothetical protein Q3G72_017731 [Acer saccharum]|nr:hypothetical protein Q3G72_017731 [Acer saccharum]
MDARISLAKKGKNGRKSLTGAATPLVKATSPASSSDSNQLELGKTPFNSNHHQIISQHPALGVMTGPITVGSNTAENWSWLKSGTAWSHSTKSTTATRLASPHLDSTDQGASLHPV